MKLFGRSTPTQKELEADNPALKALPKFEQMHYYRAAKYCPKSGDRYHRFRKIKEDSTDLQCVACGGCVFDA